MKQKISLAVSAALFSMSANSAAELSNSLNDNEFSPDSIQPAQLISINKNNQASVKQQPPKFILEKGLEDRPYQYIIRLQDQAVANYDGGIQGYPATNPQVAKHSKGAFLTKANGLNRSHKLDANAPEVKSYAKYLKVRQTSFLNAAEKVVAGLETLATYQYAFNGVAVNVTPAEAEALSKLPNVKTVERSLMYKLDTDVGPILIGADGVWDGSATDSGVGTLGEGVIVGIIDSGINSDHPSFADIGSDGYDHTNPFGEGVYVGDCAGDFPEMCNDKLIGVRSYPSVTDVYSDTTVFPADLPANGEDYDGHGSHVASTAAGNVLTNVNVLTPDIGAEVSDGIDTGFDFDRMSGVAPHANIIAYQVCFPGANGDTYSGCNGTAILSAQEDAILDGIDVANYSIGIAGPNPNLAWTNSSELGFLAMRNAGIFVATSAGNSGPDAGTTTKQAPWYTAVAASTHGREIEYSKEIGEFTGGDTELGTLTGSNSSGGITASIVYAGDFENSNDPGGDPAQCLQPFPEGTFSGEIVVCDRGAIARVQKAINARDSGAGGVVLANLQGGATSVNNDVFVIPGIHIDADQGDLLKSWLASGEGHTATITASEGNLVFGQGDDLAGFSSRGPNITASTLSPFVAAPGVDIYAAYADEDYGNDVTGAGATDFNFLGGTSMASPHVAGAGALLTALHPSWSPDNIRSALMMTATSVMRKEDGETPADWFDMGSGRIQVGLAAQAGLVMDETAANYEDANPNLGGDPRTLNIPSMVDNTCIVTCSWTRTVTATKDGSWSASGSGFSPDLNVSVSPESFELTAGESQELMVTAAVTGSSEEYLFGELNLTSSSSPDLHMPVAVLLATADLPESVGVDADRDAGSFVIPEITAAAVGELGSRTFGLTKASRYTDSILEDSINITPFDNTEDGVAVFSLNVVEDSAYLVAEIAESESPDLDLFIVYDANTNGVPEASELVEFAATASAFEKVVIEAPEAGNYFILVQNWSSSTPGSTDEFSLLAGAADGTGSGTLTVDTSDSEGAIFDIRVDWTIDGVEGDKYYGAFSLGSSAEQPDNLGSVLIEIERRQDDVQISGGSETLLEIGDQIEYTLQINPNPTEETRDYDISIPLPAGVELVEGSLTGGTVNEDGSLQWNVSQAPESGLQPFYSFTSNATDPLCANPNFGQGGGYLDLALFGVGFSDMDGDITAGTFNTNVSFLGELYPSATLTDDGFITVTGDVGGTPWINQLMPDSATPNGVIAPFWRDMILNRVGGSGVSVATAGPNITIFEWDNMEPWTPDGSSTGDILDFQVIFRNNAGPNTPNIIFSYANVTHANLLATSIGYEDTEGNVGASAIYAGSQGLIGDLNGFVQDGAQMCLWLTQPESTQAFTFTLEVTEDNEGGPIELVATSSLPNNIGTETEDSAANIGGEVRTIGDWDGDHDIDINDINALFAAISLEEEIHESFDLNNDGSINIFDVYVMYSMCSRAGCAAE